MHTRYASRFIALVMLAVTACGGSATKKTVTPDADEPPATKTATPAADEPPGSFEASMAGLRPPGTEAVLARLEDQPQNPEAHARAALAYAETDAAGMTLLWGLMRAAMTPDMLASEDVALAMTSVLTKRVTTESVGQDRSVVSLRLAPGGIPAVTDPSGALRAPVVHLFELSFVPATAAFEGTWSLETIANVLGSYVSLLEGDPSFGANVELCPWLIGIARAGHLEAFVYEVFGPAFPTERAAFDPAAVDAMRRYVSANPLRPTRPLLPDDLLPMVPPSGPP